MISVVSLSACNLEATWLPNHLLMMMYSQKSQKQSSSISVKTLVAITQPLVSQLQIILNQSLKSTLLVQHTLVLINAYTSYLTSQINWTIILLKSDSFKT